MWNSNSSVISTEEDMDILDVDEELKDDSFFAREDKTHDDVCNILQQWKMNMQPAQQQQEQDYKLNSKTFTRPKKRSLNYMGGQNLNDSSYGLEHFQNPTHQQQMQMQNNNDATFKGVEQFGHGQGYGHGHVQGHGHVNLQIGGYVTNMHKSFLSDTSPPPSMDMSLSNLNNSLITSADFSNMSFLQTSHDNMDLDNDKDLLANDCGYSFNDLMRDRKALDSLTLSADGTLIKDSNIAQIDDISLALSKTTSSCSTMDNSTNSVESSNLYFVDGPNKTFDGTTNLQDGSHDDLNATTILAANHKPLASRAPLSLEQTMILGSDMIADTTFSLDAISIIENEKNSLNLTRPMKSSLSGDAGDVEGGNKENEKVLNVTKNLNSSNGLGGNNQTFDTNETYKKPLMDETQCLMQNATFEMQANQTPDQQRCETPENKLLSFCISTPQTNNLHHKKQQFTPSLHKKEELNISPIIGCNRQQQQLNETYDYLYNKNKVNKNSETFSGGGVASSPPPVNDLDNFIELPITNRRNDSFSRNYHEFNQDNLVATDLDKLNDLANVEAKLLAAHDDGVQFEHMLEELSKVHMTDDQNKMKKSIESIKKRLNCVAAANAANAANASNSSNSLKNDFDSSNHKEHDSSSSSNYPYSQHHHQHQNHLHRSLNDTKNDIYSPIKENSSGLSRSADRLLSRRSRLYDNINLTTINNDNRKSIAATSSDIMNTTYGDTNATTIISSTNSNSNSSSNLKMPNDLNLTQCLDRQDETGKLNETTNESVSKDSSTSQETGKQRAANNDDENTQENDQRRVVPSGGVNKRERDRDRFKTIKIVRDHDPNRLGYGGQSGSGGYGVNNIIQPYNVPCIDDDGYVNNADDVATPASTNDVSYVLDNKDHDHDDQDVNTDGMEPDFNTAVGTTVTVPQFNHTNNNNYNENEFNTNTNMNTNTTTNVTKINTNYLTFKYPKDKQTKRQIGIKSIPTIEIPQNTIKPPATNSSSSTTQLNSNTTTATTINKTSSLQAPRSLSRPRYLSHLQKFTAVSKATSAGDLDLTSSNASSNESLSARKSKINGAGLPLNRTSIAGAATNTSSNLKSPMGIKSKSFHNLSNQVTANVGISSNQTRNIGQSKLQRPANKPNSSATANYSEPNQNQKSDDSAFKVPKSFSRPSTAASGIKRPGLPRPASGYYSLNNIPGKGATFSKVEIPDHDHETSSTIEKTFNETARSSNLSTAGMQRTETYNTDGLETKSMKPSTATPSSGIPKPSGLRPPSSIKRSGLPRPLSSISKH